MSSMDWLGLSGVVNALLVVRLFYITKALREDLTRTAGALQDALRVIGLHWPDR